MPQLTNEILEDARKLKPAALERLLSEGYAPGRRIADALSGDARVGAAVADILMRRCVRLLPRWHDISNAENWFYHHAVLTTRSANFPPPADPLADPLVAHGPADDAEYVAFVRAMRKLPVQQREAFILHHGERLNARMLAVAMDCSTQAAATHLNAANDAMKTIAAARIDSLTSLLTRAYADLRDSEPDYLPVVRVHVREARRRVWLRRLMRVAVVALLVAAGACALWLVRRS
jgi:DNA-directed RNA polymerase specialized sigma24 family protein